MKSDGQVVEGWGCCLKCPECGTEAGRPCHTPKGKDRVSAHDTRPFSVQTGNQKTLDEYRKEVDAKMQELYGITWADACGDDSRLVSFLAEGWTAETFVKWWGRKYDLTPRSLWPEW